MRQLKEKRRRWSAPEIMFLRRYCRRQSIHDIARSLDRDPQEVRLAVHALGLDK
jgi:hypothetical protein